MNFFIPSTQRHKKIEMNKSNCLELLPFCVRENVFMKRDFWENGINSNTRNHIKALVEIEKIPITLVDPDTTWKFETKTNTLFTKIHTLCRRQFDFQNWISYLPMVIAPKVFQYKPSEFERKNCNEEMSCRSQQEIK